MGGGGGGRGGGVTIHIYTIIALNGADLTDFKNNRTEEGFIFKLFASFQTLGIVNRRNLLFVAKWCAGTYKSSSLCKAMAGLRALLEIHISLKDIGNLLW
jgi:hypothetical protein